MRVLIVGFGSIGRKHYEILKEYPSVKEVDIVTRQKIKITNLNIYNSLQIIDDLNNYDYFVVCSRTDEHFKHLNYINSKVRKKRILVEKPLFNKKNIIPKINNKIFVGFNLRFHKVLIYLKKILINEKINYVNCFCGQYLPSWRKNINYEDSYSAIKKNGGGVLRDLSHEIDYIFWIFGEFNKIKYINTKLSSLKIDSDDIFTLIGDIKSKTVINLSLDYLSKIPTRTLIVHTENKTIKADLNNYEILIADKDMKQKNIKLRKKNINHTYIEMHKAILNSNKNINNICSYEQGQKIVNFFDKIKFQKI